MTATVKERVTYGAALLDEKKPGWREKIDLEILAISSCRYCVLGQIYHEFISGMVLLDLDRDGLEEHGFIWHPRSSEGCFVTSYELESEIVRLDEAWKEEILNERGK